MHVGIEHERAKTQREPLMERNQYMPRLSETLAISKCWSIQCDASCAALRRFKTVLCVQFNMPADDLLKKTKPI